MIERTIVTENAPVPIGPYSQAVLAGDVVFCSGQIPLDPRTGEIAGVTAAAQAERVIENIGGILLAAGLDFGDVVKTTVYLVDMADFAEVNEVYARYFSESKPARSTVTVAALPRGVRVEIEAIAKR